MRERLVAGLALAAACGVLASVGTASASTLEVDGGVIQYWQLPVDLEAPEADLPTPTDPGSLPDPGDSPATDETAFQPDPPSTGPLPEPSEPVAPPADPAEPTTPDTPVGPGQEAPTPPEDPAPSTPAEPAGGSGGETGAPPPGDGTTTP